MSALIVAQPGILQSSLQMLVRLLPQVGDIRLLEDAATAQAAISQHEPALVLLDAALSDGALSLVKSIKSSTAMNPCVVLVDEVRQLESFEAAGADLVVLKGYPAGRLLESITDLVAKASTR